MRILYLAIKAFGHFKDQLLDFQSPKPGLHLIYGHNEAGKSTSLRALKALLYGFPERTTDNFAVASNQLLVAAALENSDGTRLEFQRRKRRKADLIDLFDNPLPADSLTPFLHGIEQPVFETLYAIDHEALIQGGQEILAQKGELGKALFTASTGIASLQKISEQLHAEADELFKPRGNKLLLNTLVKSYKDLKVVLRERSLSANRWTEQHNKLEELKSQQADLEREKREILAELARLQRLHRAIPEYSLLADIQQQIAAFGSLQPLPAEVIEQFYHLQKQSRDVEIGLQQKKERQLALQKQIATTTLHQPILDHTESIHELQQRLGAYLKSQHDLNSLEAMRKTHRLTAGRLLKSLRPDLSLDDVDTLRPSLFKHKLIHELSSRSERLQQQHAQATSGLKRCEAAITQEEQTSRAFAVLPDYSLLEHLVSEARKLGTIDESISQSQTELAQEENLLAQSLQRLHLWQGSLDQLTTTPLPLEETLRQFAAVYDRLDKENLQLIELITQRTSEANAIRSQLKDLASRGQIFSEADLAGARQSRQHYWEGIHEILLRKKQDLNRPDPSEAAPLASQFEKAMLKADTIADQLRHNAEQTATAASLRSQLELTEQTLAELRERHRRVQIDHSELSTKWQAVWQNLPLVPRSPNEMLAWLAEVTVIRLRSDQIGTKQRNLKMLTEKRAHSSQGILVELTRLGLPVGTAVPDQLFQVIESAEKHLEHHRKTRTEYEQVTIRLEQLRQEKSLIEKTLEALDEQMTGWQTEWIKICAGLSSETMLAPAEAIDRMETLREIMHQLDEGRSLQRRIDGIQRDADSFTKDAEIIITQCGLERSGSETLQELTGRLRKLSDENRQAAELIKHLKNEQARLKVDIQELTSASANISEQMATMQHAVGCDKPEDLGEHIRQASQLSALVEKESDAQATCARRREGIAEDEFLGQLNQISIDQLPAQIEALQQQINHHIDPRLKELLIEIGQQNMTLQSMNGGAEAATTAEELAQTVNRIQRHTTSYLKLKLAASLLNKQIDQYRKAHQHPLLHAASSLFNQLTLGSFSTLSTDIDENDMHVLSAHKADGQHLYVDTMSSGTRDQLFLALRLASMQLRCQQHEPFPFIVDDILINFDDSRAKSCLNILGNISKSQQIILFTHHQKIVDMALQIAPESPVKVHHLSQKI